MEHEKINKQNNFVKIFLKDNIKIKIKWIKLMLIYSY